MDPTDFATHAIRGTLLLASGLVAVRLLGRARPALRRLVLALALGGALLSPVVSAAVPSWRIAKPDAIPVARPFAEPLADGATSHASPSAEAGQPAAPAPLLPTAYGVGAALAVVWALGALAVVARLAHGLARARALVRRGAPVDLDAWGDALAHAQRETGARACVLVSDDVDAPAVTGVLTPTILVPRSAEDWSDARRRLVLVHELAHVRQLDCLAHVTAQLACAMHWFNPLSWLAARRLRIERELAADDWVLAVGARPSTYAEELLAIAGVAGAARPVPHGALGMAQASELGARVVSILEPARARGPLSPAARALVLGLGATATVTIACASPDRSGPTEGPTARANVAAAGSTIVPALQTIAAEELEHLATEWRPASAVIVVLDPATGEILADAWRSLGVPADPAIRKAYIPGSTLKTITIAAALEDKAIAPTQRFDCAERYYGKERMFDASTNGTLDVTGILSVSSNIGISRIYDALGAERLMLWLRRFHFGEAPGVAEGAAAGTLPERIRSDMHGARVALGQDAMASPLQIAAAYAAIANGGVYVAPTLAPRSPTGAGERLVSAETAHDVLAMLEAAVNAERATGKAARIDGYRVAGKTGTVEEEPGAGRYVSFVGVVPADAPRFVILVGAETAVEEATGGKVAAPIFARVAARALVR